MNIRPPSAAAFAAMKHRGRALPERWSEARGVFFEAFGQSIEKLDAAEALFAAMIEAAMIEREDKS